MLGVLIPSRSGLRSDVIKDGGIIALSRLNPLKIGSTFGRQAWALASKRAYVLIPSRSGLRSDASHLEAVITAGES